MTHRQIHNISRGVGGLLVLLNIGALTGAHRLGADSMAWLNLAGGAGIVAGTLGEYVTARTRRPVSTTSAA